MAGLEKDNNNDSAMNHTDMESPFQLEGPPKMQNKPHNNLPRKRRRRTVVSGAPDDCFTCAKRREKCDRRRPFCSQCLDHGRECSGYKMNLTWGVGVASRGKMRGLSLPVLGAQPAGIPPKPQKRTAASKGPKRLTQHSKAQLSTVDSSDRPTTAPAPSAYTAAPDATPVSSADDYPLPQQGSSSSSSSPGSDVPGSVSWMPSRPNIPSYTSPYQPAPQAIAVPGLCPYPCMYQSPYYPWHDPTCQTWTELAPASTERRLFSSVISDAQETKVEKVGERRQFLGSHGSDSSLWTLNNSLSFSQLLLARSVGRTPRLKYLISYYAEVIAPVIIAFDSSTNPFRTHILRLAEDSEALQEAIATLSASNLRQRRDRRTVSTERTLPARMSSMAHRALTEGALQVNYGMSISEGIAREVLYHRGMAVRALNADLADPRRRLSDSVLATLLILCLFHACDTGVAKFQTQFAGVRKLFALRMRSPRAVSDDLKWFVRMFTWFDTITAAMNDREVQLQETCLDITALSDGEWPLENLAGCDGNLFRLVAQVGRLNLLSQNKPIGTPAPRDMFMPIAPLPPSMLPYSSIATNHLPISEAVNNYGFPLPSPPYVEDLGQHPSANFWSEWFSLRQKLESWSFNPSMDNNRTPTAPFTTPPEYMSPPLSPSLQCQIAPENLQDIFHISEAFRHSAILYCERLAYPALPSSHPRFQSIVHISMRHISAVQSDVYLLWPLFITGSECVDESHRAAIRNRCTDISKDSGFSNNLSCLELLEKIWASNSNSNSNGWVSAVPGQNVGYPVSSSWTPQDEIIMTSGSAGPVVSGRYGFKWHDVMQEKRADGEYMVV